MLTECDILFCVSAMRPEAVCVNTSTGVDIDNVDSDNVNCVVTGEVLTSVLHEDDQVGTDLLTSVFTSELWLLPSFHHSVAILPLPL